DAAALGDAEIGPLADHLGADRLAVDAQRIVGAVADLGMLSAAALTKVPMPPKNSRSTSAASRWRISSAGVRWSASMAKRRFISALTGIALRLRSKTPPPGEISRRS